MGASARAAMVGLVCATLIAGCSGASGDAEEAAGAIAGAYGAGRVVDARLVGPVTVAGESGMQLRIRDDVLDPVGPVLGDLAPGTTVDLLSPAIDLEKGALLIAFVAKEGDTADRITYALDPTTDAPAPGFDADLPSGAAQTDVLDCLVETYPTEGDHRRQDALLADMLVQEADRALPGCVARFAEP